MTQTEADMAKVLDQWVEEGRISEWSDLAIEIRDDGSVAVVFTVRLMPGITFDLKGSLLDRSDPE